MSFKFISKLETRLKRNIQLYPNCKNLDKLDKLGQFGFIAP